MPHRPPIAWYIADLDRKKLIGWLEMEKQSRTAPQEVTEALGKDVTTVTTNLTALLTPLSSSSELKEVRIYLDDDYEKMEQRTRRASQTTAPTPAQRHRDDIRSSEGDGHQ